MIAERKEIPVEFQKENKSSISRESYVNAALAQQIKPMLG
jgi:hypothetical protein